MQKGYFITGTDTNVGKTWTTLSLLQYFKNQGKAVVGMKPVASGSVNLHGTLKNEDALHIQAYASVAVSYEMINPYTFEEPVSPHIAGKDNPVSLKIVMEKYKQLQALADIVIVEGAGGWLSPVNYSQDNSDLARSIGLPVILVVAVRLGCINHAKLTALAIGQSGAESAGWIAVCTEPRPNYLEEVIQTIDNALTMPLLGIIPYQNPPDFNFFARQLTL
jgi:dethiobiotin synthetase